MVKYPEVQAHVHTELDEVVRRNRLPKLSDKPDCLTLPYTEAVLSEIHRIVSLAPVHNPQES